MRPPDVAELRPGPRLDAAIRILDSQPDGASLNQFFRAAGSGLISLTVISNHRAAWTPRALKSSLPTIVLISDDRGDSHDPAAWRCSMSSIAWARSAIIHGTGAEPWHYAEAVKAALLTGRCLFIETDSAHAPAWIEAILPRGIPGLSIIPPRGGVHPVGGAT